MTNLANHLGLDWNTRMAAPILKHSTGHGPEQVAQLLSIHRLLEKESRSDRKYLPHVRLTT
jgi:hypothetical protein